MAITNKKTLEKMKKKNLKSVRVDKDGKVTNAGKKASKKSGSIFESPRSKAIRLSTESGKANTAASAKMRAAETSFRDAKAATRDTAKTKISDRSFKSTFDSASKAGKSTFTYGGKSYMTNKGKGENRDKMKTRIAPKGSIKKKSSLDADTIASYKKRIKYMKDRKAKGKSFSAKNLSELEAKLK
jgi:hypothetical protein